MFVQTTNFPLKIYFLLKIYCDIFIIVVLQKEHGGLPDNYVWRLSTKFKNL